MSERKSCAFGVCNRAAAVKGYCQAHYQQIRNGKELTPIRLKGGGPKCSFPKCQRPARSRGLCATHYGQHLRGQRLRPILPRERAKKVGKRNGHLPWVQRIDACSRRDEETGCLLWCRELSPAGSAVANIEGKKTVVAPIAYSVWFKDVAGAKHVKRACGNLACLEPAHMYVIGKGDPARNLYLSAAILEMDLSRTGLHGEDFDLGRVRVVKRLGGVMVSVSGVVSREYGDKVKAEFEATIDRQAPTQGELNAWTRMLTARRVAGDDTSVKQHPVR